MPNVIWLNQGNVVEDALVVSNVLNENSWQTISKVAELGEAQNYWSVGDSKEIVLNGTVGATNAGAANFNNETVSVFIIGFDHNAAVEGGGRIHFQLGKKDGTPIALVDGMYGGYKYTAGYFIMNTEDSSTGGWADCQMRQTVLGSNSAIPCSNLFSGNCNEPQRQHAFSCLAGRFAGRNEALHQIQRQCRRRG